jgi:hypothetical protein
MQRTLALTGPPVSPRAIDVPDVYSETGVDALFGEFGGAIFAHGAYRIHDPTLVPRWTELAVAAFPELPDVVLCFASDWLGRQFALAAGAAPDGRPGVVLIDLHSDAVLKTHHDLDRFHDDLLASDPEPVLALELYGRWRGSGGAVPAPDQCVDYTIPVYLGGADDLSNMAIADMVVTWDIGGQLLRQVRNLPPGTRISGIDIV